MSWYKKHKDDKGVELYREDEAMELREELEDIEAEDMFNEDGFIHSDMWYDCDYYIKDGDAVHFIEFQDSNKIRRIIVNDFNDILEEEDEEIIKRFCYRDGNFYDEAVEEKGWHELRTWQGRIDTEKERKEWDEAKIKIKYRGGAGYIYALWVIK